MMAEEEHSKLSHKQGISWKLQNNPMFGWEKSVGKSKM